MEDKLRRYIEGIFEETTPTKKSVELKEEMLQNLQDKYNDLLQEGKTPEAAFNIAVAGIGDVRALLEELENEMSAIPNEAARQKSALLTAIAVMLYILCSLPLIVLSAIGARYSEVIGLSFLFGFIAIATGLLVYNNMTKPRYYKQSDELVEEFREWQGENHDRKRLRSAISSAIWTVATALYFIISFATRAWYITWVIFIAAGAIEALVEVAFSIFGKKK